MSEGSQRQTCEPTNRNIIEGRDSCGELAHLFVTALPPICCKTAMTSEPFKSYWGIRMWKRQWFIGLVEATLSPDAISPNSEPATT